MEWLSFENLISYLEQFTKLGPIGGILLAMIEAFFPPLPLTLFVTINVIAFGFLQGYLYSWVGTCIGTLLMFVIIKRFGTGAFQRKIQKSKKLKNIFTWIKEKGFIPIFILFTFPFTPSFFVCGLAALAGVKNRAYIYATILGKMIMVLSLSFIGYNISSFIDQPVKSLIFIGLTLIISFIAKRIIGIYEKKMETKQMKKMSLKKRVGLKKIA